MLFVVFSALVALAGADCSNQLAAFTAAQNDPHFNWLIGGIPADQKANLTAICDPTDTTAMVAFNARLASLAECMPTTNGTYTPVQLIFQTLNQIMCLKVGNDLCALGVLALFDYSYFLSIALGSGGIPPLPNLKTVLENADRKAAVCKSDTCNSLIEQATSGFSRAALDDSDDAGLAGTEASVNFVRKIVNRPRCGCFTVDKTTCYGAQGGAVLSVADDFTSGTNTFTAAACVSGAVVPCARVFSTCDEIAFPTCPSPVCRGFSGSIEFEVKNLNKTCFFEKMVGGAALRTISQDLSVNLLGTATTDFACDCPLTNTANWLHCNCSVTCVDLSNFNENAVLAKLKAYTTDKAATTSFLDRLVPRECQLDPTKTTYGTTLAFTITTPAGTITGAGCAHAIGFGVAVAALLALF